MRLFWRRAKPRPPRETDGQVSGLDKALEKARALGAFPGLSSQELRGLFQSAALLRLSAGQRLFESGERADRMFVVLSGSIHLKHAGEIHVEALAPGDWICDVDLDDPGLYVGTAVARTSSVLLVIEASVLPGLDQDLGEYLRRRMGEESIRRIRRLSDRIETLVRRESDFVDLLYDLNARQGSGFAQSPAMKLLFSKVKGLPVSSVGLLTKMLDERTTKNEIVELVTMDPALTSTLLRAAGSPLFGFRYKVTNVGHAIVLMGHDIVYQIIMSESMRESLPGTPFFTELHRRSIEVSRIASSVSEALSAGRPAEVATLGLLCDIGFVVTELLKTYNPGLSQLFEDLDPAEMGAELLLSWGLPEVLCEGIRYSRYPSFAPPHRIPIEVRASVAALYLARCCYEDIHQVEGGRPRLFHADYLAALGYPDLTQEALLRERVLPRLRSQLRNLPSSLAEQVRRAGS